MSEPYAVDVPLRWGDMDAYGHVNNVVFLQYLEQARVLALRDWFGQERRVLEEGILVARSEIEYLVPLEYREAPVRVSMWVSRIGGAGYDIAYRVHDPEDVGDAVYAVAESGMVLYDFTRAAPRRVSPAERTALEGLLGEPAPLRRRR